MRRLYLVFGVAVVVNGASLPVTENPGGITLGYTAWDWRYDAMTDAGGALPAAWAGVCATGNQQSPIDVVTADLKFDKYDPGKVKAHLFELDIEGDVFNTERHITYKITQALRPYITGGPLESKYVFDHMDFHFGSDKTQGSEHTIGGKKYPMEIALIFYDGDMFENIEEAAKDSSKDALATVSYMVEIDTADNVDLKPIVDALSSVDAPVTAAATSSPSESLHIKTANMNLEEDVKINFEKLFGLEVDDYYYYDGSLTTPGCTENVRWILSNKRLKISTSQLDKFRMLKTMMADNSDLQDNFRPVQTGDRIKDIKSAGVFWRRAKYEVDPNVAQILGASLVGAGVFHQVYTVLKDQETAKALIENPLVDFINNLPFLSEQEVVQQRSSDELQHQYGQGVYQPQQYQQYLPQPAPAPQA